MAQTYTLMLQVLREIIFVWFNFDAPMFSYSFNLLKFLYLDLINSLVDLHLT